MGSFGNKVRGDGLQASGGRTGIVGLHSLNGQSLGACVCVCVRGCAGVRVRVSGENESVCVCARVDGAAAGVV